MGLLRHALAWQEKLGFEKNLKKTYDEDHRRKSRGTKLTSMGFDVSFISKIFATRWTLSNVAQYGTPRATPMRTETKTLCREARRETGRYPKRVVSPSLCEVRRSWVMVLDCPLIYRSSNVVGGLRCQKVMKNWFSAKQGTNVMARESLQQVNTP